VSTEANLRSSGAIFIFKTFVVSVEQANDLAAGYVDLIDAKGGDVNAFSVTSFNELITKQLQSKYQWKDLGAKAAWEKEKQDGVDGYNGYINAGKNPLFKKW
jgi:hypothetical protein